MLSLKPSYYLEAMDMYRYNIFKPKSNAVLVIAIFCRSHFGKNVIFLFISDTISWVKDVLIGKRKISDVYFVSSNDIASPKRYSMN